MMYSGIFSLIIDDIRKFTESDIPYKTLRNGMSQFKVKKKGVK